MNVNYFSEQFSVDPSLNETTDLNLSWITSDTGQHLLVLMHSFSLVHQVWLMFYKLSLIMRKPAFCICENKDADQLRGYQISFAVTAKLISAFVFAI